VLRGGSGVEFARFEVGEIGGAGAFETALAVDRYVDFFIRKNEPIFGWLVM
jgi:hypothetical protein